MKYTTNTRKWLTIITIPVANAQSTTIEIMVKAWSIYESSKTNGLSHFLEHMFFKGGTTYQTPRDVALALDSIGASYNAYTSDEYAWYYVKSSPDFFEKAIDILQDMMVNTQFPEAEMEREKWVVIQEIKMYDDDPASLVRDKRGQYFYGDNNFGRSILGTPENVQSFTRDDLLTHKKSLYTKDNMVIVVAGRIDDEEAMLDRVSDAFNELPAKKDISYDEFVWVRDGGQEAFFEKWTEQNHIIFSAPWISSDDDNKYAVAIAAHILWWTMSSRLFQRIREQQWLCYYISAHHSHRPSHGYIGISAGMSKERFAEWKQRIIEELQLFAEQGVTQEEFDLAKNNMRGSFQMGIETSKSMGSFVGKQQLLYGSIKDIDEVLSCYMNVTLEDVQKATNFFHPEKMITYWIE